MKKIIIALFLCLSGIVFAAEPVFTADFEENFSGKSRGRVIDGKVSQELLWETLQNLLQPGIKGSAAVIGTSADKGKLYHAVYKNDNILTPFEGTVSFCVKPVNWDGGSRDFHVLFQASGPDSTLIVYKYINSNNLMFLLGPSRPVKGKYLWGMAGGSVKKWKAGEWHHIAAAYDKKQMELFIDGKRVSVILRKALPEKTFSTFSAGALSPRQWKTSLGLTLLDQLKIYDKKLSRGEIAKLAAVCGRKSKTEITGTATIVDRKSKKMQFYFTVEGIAEKCLVTVSDKSGKTLFRQDPEKVRAQNQVAIDLSGFAPGVYTLCAAALDEKNKTLCQKELTLTIPRLPEAWKNNRIGAENKVLAPWKPLKHKKGNTVDATGGMTLEPSEPAVQAFNLAIAKELATRI